MLGWLGFGDGLWVCFVGLAVGLWVVAVGDGWFGSVWFDFLYLWGAGRRHGCGRVGCRCGCGWVCISVGFVMSAWVWLRLWGKKRKKIIIVFIIF